MAKAKLERKFVVTLKSRRGETAPAQVSVEAKNCSVNQRGDLLFSNNESTYYHNSVVACFAGGSWLFCEAMKINA